MKNLFTTFLQLAMAEAMVLLEVLDMVVVRLVGMVVEVEVAQEVVVVVLMQL